MRKVILMITALFLVASVPALGQTKGTKGKDTFGKKVSKFWKKAKKELETAGHELGDAIGFDDQIQREDDLLKIDGTYYMPVYKTNLYKGQDANEYIENCRAQFSKRYPGAVIEAAVIPQTDWIVKTVEQDDEIKGYQQTLYCYVLGRDGDDGYINAKYIYTRYKKVGGNYNPVSGKWGYCERTDVLPNAIYAKLLNK